MRNPQPIFFIAQRLLAFNIRFGKVSGLMFVFSLLTIHYSLLTAQDLGNITKQNPFEISGVASASAGYYASSSFNGSRKPYSYSIMLAPTISVYGVQIPFNFTFTEGSKSVNNPFAQFGINPYYKWAKGYFGWTNMTWSPTTLNGKTFLGAGIELNPSLFRFGAFYGIMNPAIKENLLGPNPQQPQFKRRGWGLKLGVGNADNHFDFIWLHSKDVAGSIPKPSDTLNQLNYTPQENAVFGIKSHQAMFKKKLIWDLDGAASAITRDLNSQLLDVGNGFGTKFLKVAIPIHLSTSLAWTAHTNLTYKAETFSLGFDYNRVQPEYVSHGLDYIMNDQQKFSLVQTFMAAKKKVNVSLSQFYQHDNLNKRKSVKTNRTGLSGTIALNISQLFGAAISYNNYITVQSKGIKELNDTTKLFQMQQSIVFAPHFTIVNTKMVHSIFLSVSYSRLDDFNRFTSKFSKNSTVNTNIGYSLSVIKIGFTASPSFNVLYSETPAFKLVSIGPTIGLSKNFLKGKISASTSITYVASRQNDVWTSKTLTNNIGLSYRVTNNHAIKLSNNIMHTTYLTGTSSEYKGDLTYTYTFGYIVKSKTEQEKNF
jgi:hypothetical protein